MEHERFSIANYIDETESFHFARKHLAKRFPKKAHDHDYYEVFLIENGRTQHWINGELQMLEAGQLIFMRPSDRHALRADRKLGCRIINVMFRNETAQHLGQRYKESIGTNYFASESALPEIHSLGTERFKRAVTVATQLQSANRSLARIEEFLLFLVNRVADADIGVDAVAPNWFKVAHSSALSPDVFRRGASAFVEACGRSHEHVCRTSKHLTGMTPSQLVNKLRIEHAASLLRSDEIPIEVIAEECGFDNTGYFYRLFRQRYGTTPRRYRQEHLRQPF